MEERQAEHQRRRVSISSAPELWPIRRHNWIKVATILAIFRSSANDRSQPCWGFNEGEKRHHVMTRQKYTF